QERNYANRHDDREYEKLQNQHDPLPKVDFPFSRVCENGTFITQIQMIYIWDDLILMVVLGARSLSSNDWFYFITLYVKSQYLLRFIYMG
ncbi:MAG: hypothetical protein Q4F60_03345, partial [Candidatus Saccharibacteria bacterium]|nr:hypothetical protein [Candidatus Saccharibacteria bacterium]